MKTWIAALVFVFSPATFAFAQSTTRVSVDSSGAQANNQSFGASISADGRHVVFSSAATNLVSGDTNGTFDVFRRDRFTGQTTRVSVDSNGAQGNSWSYNAQIAAEGGHVVFKSGATNLVPGDANATDDVYVKDLTTGLVTLASVSSTGVQANDYCDEARITPDGRFVVFFSGATTLTPGDSNGKQDVFVHDCATGQTTCESMDGNGNSDAPSISADGRYVLFHSAATNLVAGDTNGAEDVFVHDRLTGQTTRVNLDSSGLQTANGNTGGGRISDDGRFALFGSTATNLVAGDTNGMADAFLRDLSTGQTSRISLDSAGGQGNGASFPSEGIAGGRYVFFVSAATNLVPGDTNGQNDVFVRDLTLGRTTRVSVDTLGGEGNGLSTASSTSADGRFLAFDSYASNLVAGDTNGLIDVFVRDGGALPTTDFCFGDGTQANACPCANWGAPGHGCENSLGTSGALLAGSGSADPDSLLLSASSVIPGVLAMFLQGNVELNPGVSFGDGVRCVGGTLKRLYVKVASGGVTHAPAFGDNSVRAQSALLGDVIAPGTSRFYQMYYRDSDDQFCVAPVGNTWNVSNGVRVDW